MSLCQMARPPSPSTPWLKSPVKYPSNTSASTASTTTVHDIGQVTSEIGPLYRDIEGFSHRCCGFANTVRMLPTDERRDLPGPKDLDNDTFVVIKATGIDVGNIGSENSFNWTLEGAKCRSTGPVRGPGAP